MSMVRQVKERQPICALLSPSKGRLGIEESKVFHRGRSMALPVAIDGTEGPKNE